MPTHLTTVGKTHGRVNTLMALTINTAGLGSFKPHDGKGLGPQKLFKMDGPYAFKVEDAKGGKSDKGYTTATLTLACQDEEEQGAVLYEGFAVDGVTSWTNSKGEEKSRENIHALGRLLVSAGYDADFISNLVKQGSVDLEKILEDLKGKTVYARIEREDGRDGLRSRVRFFIRKEQYDRARTSGVNWRLHPRVGNDVTPVKNGATRTGGRTEVSDQVANDV